MQEPKEEWSPDETKDMLDKINEYPCAFANEDFGDCHGPVVLCTWEPVYDELNQMTRAGLVIRLCEPHRLAFEEYLPNPSTVGELPPVLQQRQSRPPLWERRN